MREQSDHLNGPSVLQHITGITLNNQRGSRIEDISSGNLVFLMERTVVASIEHHHRRIGDAAVEILQGDIHISILDRVFLPIVRVLVILKELWCQVELLLHSQEQGVFV